MIHVAEILALLGALSIGGAPAAAGQSADVTNAVYTNVPGDQGVVTPVRRWYYGHPYGAYYPGWYGAAPRYYYRPYYGYYPRRYYYGGYPGYSYGYYPYGYNPYGFYYRGPRASFGFSF
jgi:hypothetical protein